MYGEFNNLDCRCVSGLYCRVLWQRHLREADGSGKGVVGGTENLEHGNHGESHVRRTTVRTVVAEAHVDVGECCLVTAEPARLESDGTTCRGPVCTVCCNIVTTALLFISCLSRVCLSGKGTYMDISIACHRERSHW